MVDLKILERQVAGWAAALLGVGSTTRNLAVPDSADGLSALELLVPAVLSRTYPEWDRESIDGFRVASTSLHSDQSLTLLALCILITDQSVTPCRIALAIDSERGLSKFDIALGEPGGGSLGVSGPPCNSQSAEILLAGLDDRAELIAWVYRSSL